MRRYFSGELHRFRVKPTVFMPALPALFEPADLDRLLVGLSDGAGGYPGIGYLEHAPDEGVIRLISPVAEGPKALRLGSVRLDVFRANAWTSGICSDRNRRSLRAFPGQERRKKMRKKKHKKLLKKTRWQRRQQGLRARSVRVAVPFRARPISIVVLARDGARGVRRTATSRSLGLSAGHVRVPRRRQAGGPSVRRRIDRRRAVAHATRRSALVVRVREPSRRRGVPRAHLRLSWVLPGRPGRVLRESARSRRSGRTCWGRPTSSWSQGARTVALVGASMGGTASLVAAGQEGSDVAVVVTLSAPASIEGLDANAALLQGVDANKLFIAGVGDAAAAASAESFSQIAPPPKGPLEIVWDDDHGTDLLTGSRE